MAMINVLMILNTKYMSFLIKDYELLEKCNKIRETGSDSIKKGFDNYSV